jgi:hypothetical protein
LPAAGVSAIVILAAKSSIMSRYEPLFTLLQLVGLLSIFALYIIPKRTQSELRDTFLSILGRNNVRQGRAHSEQP